MSTGSSIEWTEATWNPITGCDHISPGCDNCYALTLAKRLKAMGSAKYQNDGDPRTSGPGFGVTVHDDAITEPLRWRTPRTVFLNSMSDIAHARVGRRAQARIWAVMALTGRHQFQVLTKRPKRLAAILADPAFVRDVAEQATDIIGHTSAVNVSPATPVSAAAGPPPLPTAAHCGHRRGRCRTFGSGRPSSLTTTAGAPTSFVERRPRSGSCPVSRCSVRCPAST
jgi:hypothetical protein